MSITIIGGSGFVGSFLIKELQDYKVGNLDKNSSPFYDNITINGDIRNLDEIKIPKGTETIVLLAAEHRDDVSPTSLYYDVNVQGTKNVLQAMDKSGVKNLIFTSSVAIYGLNKENPDENHDQDPFNHYGKSKWEAELVIKEWFEKELKPIGDKQMQYVAVMSVVQFMTFCFMLVSFWINSKIF